MHQKGVSETYNIRTLNFPRFYRFTLCIQRQVDANSVPIMMATKFPIDDNIRNRWIDALIRGDLTNDQLAEKLGIEVADARAMVNDKLRNHTTRIKSVVKNKYDDVTSRAWILMQCIDATRDDYGNLIEENEPVPGFDTPMSKTEALKALQEIKHQRPDVDFSIKRVALVIPFGR